MTAFSFKVTGLEIGDILIEMLDFGTLFGVALI